MMTKFASCLSLLAAILVAAPLMAAPKNPVKGSFQAQGRQYDLVYDPTLVAVPFQGRGEADRGIGQDDAFTALGVTLVSISEANAGQALGAPLWLSSGAVGVLTPRVVVGADLETVLKVAPSVAAAKVAFVDDVTMVHVASPGEALELAAKIRTFPGVRWAHPDLMFAVESRSIDPIGEPYFSQQWHLSNIDAPRAWQVTTGDAQTVVAVLDLGFEESHPDMAGAWHVNAGEIPGNRKDDDGNGYVDDLTGWNFAINGPNLVYGANSAHGTAAAGVIGARANGIGVTGICPSCRILPVVIDHVVSNAAAGFYYARDRGATVISNSWGYKVGTPATDVVVEAIERVAREGRQGKGITIVFAMSNFHKDDCRGPEPDISSLEAVIAVSSVDKDDRKVHSAAHGPCLDLVAPSSASVDGGVLTTDRPGEKGYNRGDRTEDVDDLDYTNSFYGTSAATPQVAGAFGLLYSSRPDLRAVDAKDLVYRAADKVQEAEANYDPVTGHSRMYGHGRLNLSRILGVP